MATKKHKHIIPYFLNAIYELQVLSEMQIMNQAHSVTGKKSLLLYLRCMTGKCVMVPQKRVLDIIYGNKKTK